MTVDVESRQEEPLMVNKKKADDLLQHSRPHYSCSSCCCAKWKLLLVSLLAWTFTAWILCGGCACSVELITGAAKYSSAHFPKMKWHIDPINPLDHGKVEYFTFKAEDHTDRYQRVITAPCAYGILMFNIGPAKNFEPFAYDVYEDAYAYSENQGLCFLYPSYTGTQTSEKPLWEPSDPTVLRVKLGDQESKISTRIVVPPDSKDTNKKRGGDFLIIRKGNFYNAHYYQQLKDYINGFPPDADVEAMVTSFDPQAVSI